jgi:hypothetical protein
MTHGAGSEQSPKPASDAFVKAKLVDWSQRRYALGCYSSPSLGEAALHIAVVMGLTMRFAERSLSALSFLGLAVKHAASANAASGALVGDREALCSPVDHTIFFAGCVA